MCQLGKPSFSFHLRQCCVSSSSASCPRYQRSASQGWLQKALECENDARLTHLKRISDITSNTYKEWQHTKRVFRATATCKAPIQHVSAVRCNVDPNIPHHAGATTQQSACRYAVGTRHNIGEGQMLACISNHQKLTFEDSTEPIGQDEEGVWNSFRLWDGTTNGC